MNKVMLYIELVKLSLKKNLEFSFNFFAFFIVNIANIAVQLLFWKIIINQFGLLQGWTLNDIIILNFFSQIYYNLNWGINGGTYGFWRSIYSGELDVYLTKPVPVSFFITGLRLNIMPTLHGILLLLILGGYIRIYLAFDMLRFLIAILILMLGIYVMKTIYLCVSYATFWVKKSDYLVQLLHILTPISKYPTTIFSGILGFVLMYLLPTASIATIPTMVITNKIRQEHILMTFFYIGCMVIVWKVLEVFLWNVGLKSYESSRG